MHTIMVWISWQNGWSNNYWLQALDVFWDNSIDDGFSRLLLRNACNYQNHSQTSLKEKLSTCKAFFGKNAMSNLEEWQEVLICVVVKIIVGICADNVPLGIVLDLIMTNKSVKSKDKTSRLILSTQKAQLSLERRGESTDDWIFYYKHPQTAEK